MLYQNIMIFIITISGLDCNMLFYDCKKSAEEEKMESWTQIKECMEDSGCSAAAVRRAETLYQGGAVEELIRCLRSCRCDALEEIHEKQRQLDRLDMLIRDTKNM